jgi:uncharacterized membrane protein
VPPFAFALARQVALLLPPDIHPMVVHFPIVFLYITAVVEVTAMVVRDSERFWQRVAFLGLTAACFFTVVTMSLGFVSEQSVRFSPAMAVILSRHQHFAILTGLTEGAAWVLQICTRFRRRAGWSILGTGRGRTTWLSAALVVLAAVFVTLTARLGGKMVYDYGAGVLGVTRIHP